MLWNTAMYAGSIKGKVIDSLDNNPLYGATIRIEGTQLGAKSNAEGMFSIDRLQMGNYTLLISYVGYALAKVPITVASQNAQVNVTIALLRKDVNSNTIIVSAGKRTQSIQEVPVSVALLDQQAIQQRNVNRIDEVLRYVSGVNVARDQVSIRGSSGFALGIGSRVALLLDGFPMLSADNGDMKFDALPMPEIQRVEVVKGAGSALYGTGALGGVVSLFTRTPADTARIMMRSYAGIYTQPAFDQWVVHDMPPPLYGLDVSYSQRFDKLEFTVLGGTRYDKSYRLTDQSRRFNLFSKIAYTFDDKARTTLTGIINLAHEDKGDWVYWNSLDSATRPPTTSNPDRMTLSSKALMGVNLRHIFEDNALLNIRSSVFLTDFDNYNLRPNEEAVASNAQSFNSEIQYSRSLSSDIFLTMGLNSIVNTVEAPIYGRKQQSFVSGYAQTEVKPGIDGLVMTIGGRFDHERTDTSDAQFVISPKIAASWLAPFGVQFRASIGRGFRAATVAERYAALRFQGITVQPNLSIKPEYSISYEIGASTVLPLTEEADMLMLDIAVFNNSMDDLVEPSFLATGNVQFQNVTAARVSGIEIGMRTQFSSGFGIESSLTYMDPVDVTLNQTLPYRSSVLWYNRITIPIIEHVQFQTDYRYLSKVELIDARISALGFITDADARVPIHVCDMRIIMNMNELFGKPLTLTFNAKNVFDYYYTEIMGNLAPNRQLSIQGEILL
jgi:outer membrane receptor for ferrienterochelin and colicins